MKLKYILLTVFFLNIVLCGFSCSTGDKNTENQKNDQNPKPQKSLEPSKKAPESETPKPSVQAQAPQAPIQAPPQTTPVPTPATDEARKVFIIKDNSVATSFDKIPGEILKDFTLVNDIKDLKAGGNVLILTSTSGPRLFNDAELDKLIADKKNEGYKVSVLAMRIGGTEVDAEDYGLPAKHGIGLFRVIVGPAGKLKDQFPSTISGIDELKKHLLAP